MRATVAHIYLDHLRDNLSVIKQLAGSKTKICAPVKADGYGHGAVQIAIEALRNGASCLAVAAINEAMELRKAGISAPILLLSVSDVSEMPDILSANVTPLVFDFEFIALFAEAVRRQNEQSGAVGAKRAVHLAVDTGMGRIGCRPEDAASVARFIVSQNVLALEGVCTHLSAADSLLPDDAAYTNHQISSFRTAVSSIKDAGIDTGIIHCAASGGVLLYPESYFDMIRPGIIMYGYLPNRELADYLLKQGRLPRLFKPVMDFVSTVTAVIPRKKGDAISYGREWTAEHDTDTAVLPVGYADGLLRRLSPGFKVRINGKNYPIVGRICMDQCIVDIGKNHGIKRGDTALLFGCGDDFQTAEDVAHSIQTIPYEILCGVNKRVPRVYVGGNISSPAGGSL
ncbi:MAG: alanine racemase [Bacteroides sp.]|nr:alanine racemase [Prevotella sp.]MCM1407492.1 alanine racemase [Treponema brennaborense]MCM1469982.1 alanine racemase [Bacteroides sp.]